MAGLLMDGGLLSLPLGGCLLSWVGLFSLMLSCQSYVGVFYSWEESTGPR